MNLVDIVILVILSIFLLKGVFRGLLKEVCSLLGLVCGGLLAFYLYLPLAQWIMGMFNWPSQLCVTLAFLMIFVSTLVVFGAIGYVLNRFLKLALLEGLNRLTGAIFGFLQGVLLLALILFALTSASVPGSVRKELRVSELSPPFTELGEVIFSISRDLALR
ncbi:MAG TPA: CvpA family protein [Geopsychrobacteraceae bacterium]|nr:CvpA family protein [Geopsychrobacteraceae bacterium]